MSERTTLVVTNDYPPRLGGIETFVSTAAELLGHDVVVLTSSHPRQHEVHPPHPVHRLPTATLLPTPATTRAAVELLRSTGARRVLFGAAAPLGLLAPALRRAGARRLVALTHGHEVWWSRVPGTRRALRRVGEAVDHLGYVSEATRGPIAAAVGPRVAGRMVRLPPPVATGRFTPAPAPRPGPSAPTVLAVARMTPRKGVDVLLRAWRQVLDGWSGDVAPRLLLAGDGPRRASWQARAERELGRGEAAPRWLGAVPHERVPELMRSADVFALPVRTRFAGLSPEGLGVVFAEAAASGLPVLVGRSGGAPETVLDGISGHVLDPTRPKAWAAAMTALLGDPVRRAEMGGRGREHVRHRFSTDHVGTVLRAALDL
ncbi:glycosyltransferase [Auraticoccus sp. F435]|uniref:Glycosyltransferase n=1 Tax=Auraticoccus cholistanensis TaxID=2656650 RepID=A0A6A9UWW4_9ACTN|nr:glycosyltransferase family 4 protein [Auraticoccus cholistanensis]MVA77343.1 glycosyltransferase [Auraticoccus cholistanensis]